MGASIMDELEDLLLTLIFHPSDRVLEAALIALSGKLGDGLHRLAAIAACDPEIGRQFKPAVSAAWNEIKPGELL